MMADKTTPGGVPVGASVQVGGMRRPVLGIYNRTGGVSLPTRITP